MCLIDKAVYLRKNTNQETAWGLSVIVKNHEYPNTFKSRNFCLQDKIPKSLALHTFWLQSVLSALLPSHTASGKQNFLPFWYLFLQ